HRHGRIGVSEDEGLLRREGESPGVGRAGNVAGGSLVRQPGTHVALIRAGGVGEVMRSRRSDALEGIVKAKVLAEEYEGGAVCGRDLVNGATGDLVELCFIKLEGGQWNVPDFLSR